VLLTRIFFIVEAETLSVLSSLGYPFFAGKSSQDLILS
jgi:hypothetical protein